MADDLDKTNEVPPSVLHPLFKKEEVYCLNCQFCGSSVCERGMKSFLVADEKVELYSTDQIDRCAVDLTDEKLSSDKCKCLIENAACLTCGNVVGYHVKMPCRPCLTSHNNGHYWMFYSTDIIATPRINSDGTDYIVWGDLPTFSEDCSRQTHWEECER